MSVALEPLKCTVLLLRHSQNDWTSLQDRWQEKWCSLRTEPSNSFAFSLVFLLLTIQKCFIHTNPKHKSWCEQVLMNKSPFHLAWKALPLLWGCNFRFKTNPTLLIEGGCFFSMWTQIRQGVSCFQNIWLSEIIKPFLAFYPATDSSHTSIPIATFF